MNQKLGPLQQKWIGALESGKYNQGRGFLHQEIDGDECFCCFGVACKIFVDKINFGLIFRGGPTNKYYFYGGSCALLPRQARSLLKLRHSDGMFFVDTLKKNYRKEIENLFGVNNTSLTLICLNDKGMSFKKIAEIIKNHPDVFFSEEV